MAKKVRVGVPCFIAVGMSAGIITATESVKKATEELMRSVKTPDISVKEFEQEVERNL